MCKNFPDEVRETVSHDKPKKRAFASHDIAKERVMNVLGPRSLKLTTAATMVGGPKTFGRTKKLEGQKT